jgi:hypothetical protein
MEGHLFNLSVAVLVYWLRPNPVEIKSQKASIRNSVVDKLRNLGHLEICANFSSTNWKKSNSLCKSKVSDLQQRIFIIFNKKNVLFAKSENSESNKLDKFNRCIFLEHLTMEYSTIMETETRKWVSKPEVLGLGEPHYYREAFADQMLPEKWDIMRKARGEGRG